MSAETTSSEGSGAQRLAKGETIRYLDIHVLEAAKRRVRHMLNTFDQVRVSFSGGKDSTAVVHLVRMVLDEMGLHDTPVQLHFLDEEVIPEPVIDFVLSYNDRPGYKLDYFAVPMRSQCFIMGQHKPYIAWDPTREWMRPPPACAIRQVHPKNLPLDQHETNPFTLSTVGARGKIALLNGIRADESLTRRRSSLAKKGPYSYILGDPTGMKNVSFCRPIFDWSEGDIFKFFFDAKVDYADIYNMQMWSNLPLRVATPLHDKAYRTLSKLREMYPAFVGQIFDIWPEVATHERYWKDVDRWAIIDRYPPSWEGMMRYIDENMDSAGNIAKARDCVRKARTAREKNRRLGKYCDTPCYGFPMLSIFRALVSGTYMKGVPVSFVASTADIDFEARAAALAGTT